MKFLELLHYLQGFLKWGSSKFEILWSNKEDTACLSPISLFSIFEAQDLSLGLENYVSFELNLYYYIRNLFVVQLKFPCIFVCLFVHLPTRFQLAFSQVNVTFSCREFRLGLQSTFEHFAKYILLVLLLLLMLLYVIVTNYKSDF